ncbi:MAG TPA: cupin domain-containing protein [Rhodanobacteraceae bacterium]
MARKNSKITTYKAFVADSERPALEPAAWKWKDVETALLASRADNTFLRAGRGAVSLVHTGTGKALGVCPELNVLVQVFEPGVHNAAHRHSNFALFIVKQGRGYSIIDGEKIAWETGDVFFAPPWSTHEHCNTSRTERAILYTIQDVPTVARMGVSFFEQPVGSGAVHVVKRRGKRK